MRKLLIFFLVASVLMLMYGFRGTSWRGDRTVAGDYTFQDSTTMDKLVVQSTASFKDTVDLADARINAARFLHRASQPIVSFVAGGGTDNDYLVMKPLFDAKNVVGGLAIVTSWVGLTNRLTWAQINEMYDDGWEIINHTKTHASLDTCTQTQILAEILGADTAFINNGIVAGNFAYPSTSANSALARNLISKYFRSARSSLGSGGSRNKCPLNTYNLNSYTADNPALSAAYQAQVDTAETENSWLIFYVSEYDSDDSTTIAALIDYIQAKSIPILTINQALDLIENPIQVCDKFGAGINGDLIIKNLWFRGDTLFLTDGGEDTSYIVQSGTYLKIVSDNQIQFTNHLNLGGNSITGVFNFFVSADTGSTFGTTTARWKELWALRHYWTSPDKADSGKVYDDGTNTYFETDNPVIVTNDATFNENIYADTTWGEIDTTGVLLTTHADNNAAAAVTAMKQGTQTISATWEWDGGNIIAADGQRFIATDDAEDDSVVIYILNDTVFVVSTGLPIVIGDEGMTNIGDTLGLPLWDDKGATATLGATGLDTTGTDTAWIYTQDGWKSFVPAAAGGGSVITWNVLSSNSGTWLTSASGSSANNVFIMDGTTSDSVIIDSIRAVYHTDHNDVYIDSVCIQQKFTSTGSASSILWSDATDVGSGSATYASHSYTGVNTTVSADWRMLWWMGVATSSTAGNGRTCTAVMYCHYK